jgi:hypothetical protein
VLHHPAAPQHLHRSATASATPAARESGCSPAQGAFSFTRCRAHYSTRRTLCPSPAGRVLVPPPAVFSSPRRPPSASSSSRSSRLLLPLPDTLSSPAGRLVLPH